MDRQINPPGIVGSGFVGLRSGICIFTIFLCAGCSTLFVPQQLSENYALADGVICNAPAAVDGDLDTVSNETRILISLPEMKSIRKIIIHSPNISDFILYESTGQEGEWKIIKGIKGNKLTKVVINTQVTTDRIRMFVSDTRGTRFSKPGIMKDLAGRDVITFSQRIDVRPVIQEIELYGLIDNPEKIEPKAPLF